MPWLPFPSRGGVQVLGIFLYIAAKDGLHSPKWLSFRVQFHVFLHARAPPSLPRWMRL